MAESAGSSSTSRRGEPTAEAEIGENGNEGDEEEGEEVEEVLVEPRFKYSRLLNDISRVG